jgi:histidine triad (HIT) family protein
MANEEKRLDLAADPALEDDCEFCRIARGEATADVVCESEDCVAFFPLMPATKGHTLVVPRKHVQNFLLAGPGLGASLMSMAVKVGRALDGVLRPEGMNLISSAGSAAQQTEPHLHLHVVPRWTNDDIGKIWPPKRPTSEALMEDLAERVRTACRS